MPNHINSGHKFKYIDRTKICMLNTSETKWQAQHGCVGCKMFLSQYIPLD